MATCGLTPGSNDTDRRVGIVWGWWVASAVTAAVVSGLLLAAGGCAKTPPPEPRLPPHPSVPLLVAVETRNAAELDRHLYWKSDLTVKDADGRNAVHIAAMVNGADAIRKLADARADVNSRDNNNYTPLHAAVEGGSGFRDAVRQLLASGADPNIVNNGGRTSLHIAARNGDEELVRMLLEKGADVNAKDPNGRTPLEEAEAGGHDQVARLLRARRAGG